MLSRRRNRLYASYVLVMDALGSSQRIRDANAEELFGLWDEIDRQYSQFCGRIPNTLILKLWNGRVLGTREIEALRLNDMFIVYSRRKLVDPDVRYLVSASLLYHQMLLEGFIPRGGLGFGLIARGDGLLIGNGFIDAYERAEKRPPEIKDICAIEVSPSAMRTISLTQYRYNLLCFYKGHFFVHPYCLTDPDLGAFNRDRVLECLRKAGANEQKLKATEAFLDGFEDSDRAQAPDSESRKFVLKVAKAPSPGAAE